MHSTNKITALALCSILVAASYGTAAAQPTPQVYAPAPEAAADDQPIVDRFGARIGGYGFRQQDATGQATWDDCRMNGLGIFATKDWSSHLFTEAAADLYFSDSFPAHHETTASSMTRLSGLFSIAAGLRMFPDALISANAHAGLGLELTQVTMHGAKEGFALPVGFIGIGGDIGLWRGLRFGMNVRTLVMAHPAHGSHAHAVMLAPADGEIEMEPEVAAQAQFYLSYSL